MEKLFCKDGKLYLPISPKLARFLIEETFHDVFYVYRCILNDVTNEPEKRPKVKLNSENYKTYCEICEKSLEREALLDGHLFLCLGEIPPVKIEINTVENSIEFKDCSKFVYSYLDWSKEDGK